MTEIQSEENNSLNEPSLPYAQPKIRVFHSFEEQEEYEFREMAKRSGLEILSQMRGFINIAYGMHGYDPAHLPTVHSFRIVKLNTE